VTPYWPPWAGAAFAHLTERDAADPVMAGIATTIGLIQLTPDPDVYGRLVKAIIGQQISGKAANAIRRRVFAAVGDPFLPAHVAALSDDALRSCGLSLNKLLALRDLTTHVLDGRIDPLALASLPDEEVIRRLVAVRGVGRWTAEMLLLFGLGRPDVLPVDDLGVRAGAQRAYGLETLPKAAQMRELAIPWHPYASAASYYLWRSLDTLAPG